MPSLKKPLSHSKSAISFLRKKDLTTTDNMDALYRNWHAELDVELSWETMYKADTLEELAEKLKVAQEALVASAAEYAESIQNQPEPQPGPSGFVMPPNQPLGGPY